MIIKNKLENIFEINTGLVLSRKESKSKKYKLYNQIALKSINEKGYIDIANLEEFRSQEVISERYITKTGDIVIRLTAPYTAVAIDESTAGLLTNSYCAILRSKSINVNSKFIATYLNSGKLSEQFRKEAIGSVVQIIKVSSLKKYVIDYMPTLEIQNEIAELNDLLVDEILIIEELLRQKNILRSGIIKKIMEEN